MGCTIEYTDGNSLLFKKGTTSSKFCEKCGEALITQCPECKTPIRGSAPFSNMTNIKYSLPNYCHNCGKPFPWLDKKMKAAVEMAELEDVLSEEETSKFAGYVRDITVDNPGSQVSAKKINILLRKFGKASVVTMRALLVDIASETAKKIIKDM